jgi:hypothetical protein
MTNEQATNNESFWAPVTVNNRITIPPVICTLKGVDDSKLVKLQVIDVKPKEA